MKPPEAAGTGQVAGEGADLRAFQPKAEIVPSSSRWMQTTLICFLLKREANDLSPFGVPWEVSSNSELWDVELYLACSRAGVG